MYERVKDNNVQVFVAIILTQRRKSKMEIPKNMQINYEANVLALLKRKLSFQLFDLLHSKNNYKIADICKSLCASNLSK